MSPHRIWPLALAGVLGVTVAANVFMLFAANAENGAVVEPEYYRKAVAWDSSAALRAAGAALGWRIDATIDPLAADGAGTIRIRAVDREGAPLAAAQAKCVAIHNLDAARRPEAAAALNTEGATAITLPLGRSGMWELRVTVTRAADSFTTSLRRDAGFAPRRAGN